MWQSSLQGQIFRGLLALHVSNCVDKLNAYAAKVGSPVVVTKEGFCAKRIEEFGKWGEKGAAGIPPQLGWSEEVAKTFFMGARKGFEEAEK
jgi:hypothetical protein